MTKIYIAGPMKGMPNYDHFHMAEEKLKTDGFDVFSPARLPQSGTMTPSQYMDIDLAILRHCDMIYMLEGWIDSKGATLEYYFAVNYGIEIIFQENDID